MNRLPVSSFFAVGLLIVTTGIALFSTYFVSSPLGWLRAGAVVSVAICRDPGTQWIIVLWLVSYFIIISVLASRPYLESASADFADECRVLNRFIIDHEFWLNGFVVLALLRYASGYKGMGYSTQVPILLAGIVLGKMAAWFGQGNGESKEQEMEASQRFVRESPTRLQIISVILALLAVVALWQVSSFNVFQYHGIIRWGGVIGNPNLYGLLMGTGFVLAIGLVVWRWKMGHRELTIAMAKMENRRRGDICFVILSFVTAIICGIGLFKSYSRGAWVGLFCGLVYLGMTVAKAESGKRRAELSCGSPIAWLYDNRLILLSVVVSSAILLYWQFRFSEWTPMQRIVSMTNPDDFSWRNRVTAWEGAVCMMVDKPFLGFGWGQVESAYAKNYCPLDDSAPIQLNNDYFMLGISAGVPALICVLAYIALCFGVGRQHEKAESGKRKAKVELDWLKTTCRAGAIVLLVGFWFDGGLFNLSVGPIFWMLMELSRIESPAGNKVTSPVLKVDVQKPEIESQSWTSYVVPYWEKEIRLRRVGWALGTIALLQTTIYLSTPFFSVNKITVAIARKCLIPPKETADFDFLATNSIWRGKKLKALLEHADLVNYNRELVNWQFDDKIYRNFVLSPVITGNPDEQLNWRRLLWEEFYPRIRHETSPGDTAKIIVRYLREHIAIATLQNLPHDVPMIWLRQITDETGFDIVYVASLRSVGVAAQLNNRGQTEIYTDGGWQLAPR